ncbi:MAG TPA: preprotein translocase subunit SecG [Novosphingobium sp.]|nr:preprotein translocase subunit SecG [Novosphingobium sp.]HQA18914.1 preprotein translocase subunit SecG [Novosphingobium sp.]
MSLIIFLTVVQAIIAAMLVGVILMQKSEGGGLGVGGSPAGLMSARGAADFLTRMTTILAFLFVTLSIVLAALAASSGSQRSIEGLAGTAAPVQQAPATQPGVPVQQGAPSSSPAAPAATPTGGGLAPLTLPGTKQ